MLENDTNLGQKYCFKTGKQVVKCSASKGTLTLQINAERKKGVVQGQDNLIMNNFL